MPATPSSVPSRRVGILRAVLRARRDSFLLALAAGLPLALFLRAETRIAGAMGFPLDDAWIHLHFARNLAEGAGFAYNPGMPVAGSTAPLWTLLLAGVVAGLGASLSVVKALGVVTSLAAALVTRATALAWGAPPVLALGVGIALLWTGALGWAALSGMEVSLAALLVAGTLWAHARNQAGVSALLAALAVLARPEALLLPPLLILAGPLTMRRAALMVAIVFAVLAPVVAFNLATVGALVPAPVAAKVEGGLLGWLAGAPESLGRLVFQRPWAFLCEWVGWLAVTHGLLPVLLLPTLIAVWRRRGRALGLPVLVLILHPLAMALLAPYRGPGFQEGRYSMHLLPLALVALATALPPIPPRRQALLAGAYLVLGLVTLPAAAERHGWAVQNINAMQVHLGRWVDANLPRRARLALNDIGAIAYLSRREVIDLMGLVTPDILAYRRQGEDGVIRYVQERCPDYVIVFPSWFPAMTARRDLLEPIYGVRLARNEVAGGPEMVVYRLRRCAV
jgi:hypothetical protein